LKSDLVYLVQTDTTVGFLSSESLKLSSLKKRNPNQKILQVTDSFDSLKKYIRVPNKFKNKVRRSTQTTFIYPNGSSFRVVTQSSSHNLFVKKFTKLFSTSANETGKCFDKNYACNNVDVIVYNSEGFTEKNASSIIKINNKKQKRIR
jgi:tRNA A37 threonylcarbamoyladenosine synthetase subunit TsaC/SUA5/YrdC